MSDKETRGVESYADTLRRLADMMDNDGDPARILRDILFVAWRYQEESSGIRVASGSDGQGPPLPISCNGPEPE